MKQTLILNYLEPRSMYNKGRNFSLSKWRKKVITRDKDRCRNCFNTVKDRFRKCKFSNEAHHIVPRKHGGKNTLANGVTLCKFCHQYFGFMYDKHGLDYYQIIKKRNADVRLEQIRKLMSRRYIRHLARIMGL